VLGWARAAQHDQEAAAHEAAVLNQVSVGQQAAASAAQDAEEAQAAAAVARGAAEEAAGYAASAARSATVAAGYAQQADQAATRAAAAATKAVTSAKSAVSSAKSAATSAQRAVRSAVWARNSARAASVDARDAYGDYQRAYQSARAAGKDAAAAVSEAVAARDAVLKKAAEEQAAQKAHFIMDGIAKCDGPLFLMTRDECMQKLQDTVQNPTRTMSINGGYCAQWFNPNNTEPNPDNGAVEAYRDCMNSVLSPTFGMTQALDVANNVADFTNVVLAFDMMAILGAATIEFCWGVCGAWIEALTPLVAPELIGTPLVGIGADLIAPAAIPVFLASRLEKFAVTTKADEAALAKLAQGFTQKCLTGSSFTGDTPVLLADGTTRPIRDIRAGDRVLATDPVTGVSGPEPVTATRSRTGTKSLVDVTIAPAGHELVGTATVTATDNHPFWVPDLSRWVPAGQLRHGQWLRTSTGTWAQVTALKSQIDHATVHNFTVSNRHTYYVLAGSTPVLVHNAGAALCDGIIGIKPAAMNWNPVTKGQIKLQADMDYQRSLTGLLEFELTGTSKEGVVAKVWADGLDGSVILDAKYVHKESGSPYTGTAPDFITADIKKLLARYKIVIEDPTTPFKSLRLYTNTERSADYLRGLLAEMQIPGEVVLRP
jgi:hypothetical protein